MHCYGINFNNDREEHKNNSKTIVMLFCKSHDKYLHCENLTPSLAGSCGSGTTAVPSINFLTPSLRHTNTVRFHQQSLFYHFCLQYILHEQVACAISGKRHMRSATTEPSGVCHIIFLPSLSYNSVEENGFVCALNPHPEQVKQNLTTNKRFERTLQEKEPIIVAGIKLRWLALLYVHEMKIDLVKIQLNILD